MAAHYDRVQEYPWEIKEALCDAGLMGVWIPEEFGGAGAGVLNLCLVVEELSRACGGVGVLYAVNALGSFPILLAGTEEQKEKYLPHIAKGEKLIAFGLSERPAGSDAAGLTTQAAVDGDEYVINGEKKWTTNGGAADLYTVFAVTDPESRSRAASPPSSSRRATPASRSDASRTRWASVACPSWSFTSATAAYPRTACSAGRAGMGFKHAMMTLDHARPGVAAQAVGLAQGALDYALAYATRRKQFGQSIAVVPDDPAAARRHGLEGRGRAPARLLRRQA